MGNKIAIVLALVLGGMAVFLVNRHITESKEQFVGEKMTIVVAREKVDKGEEIREQHLAPRTVPARFVERSGSVTKWEQRGQLVGGKVRYEILPGEFVNQKIVEHESRAVNEGIFVKTGLRAYTISASGENAVANMLIIGDRIDIMGTFLILGTDQGLAGERTQKARTMFLMQDIQIKALDQVTQGKVDDDFGMLTFELDPLECLVLEFAQNTGKIKLVKRNNDDRFVDYNPDQRIEVHRENLMDFIKIASQSRASRAKQELGNR